MGAWGTGPYDNDTAADWFFNLSNTGIYDLIESGLNDEDYDIQRAAAYLVGRLAVSPYVYDHDRIEGHRKLAIEKLSDILKDEDWLNSWLDRKDIEDLINSQINEISNPNSSPSLIEKICDCK